MKQPNPPQALAERVMKHLRQPPPFVVGHIDHRPLQPPPLRDFMLERLLGFLQFRTEPLLFAQMQWKLGPLSSWRSEYSVA